MKVLLIGAYSPFCEVLIARLKRESHDVYIISGTDGFADNRPPSIRAVNYAFGVTDKKLPFIVDSISPDCILFLGAFDETYAFASSQAAVSDYLAGLANLLSVTSSNPVNQLIYLSSASVYGTEQNTTLTEDCEKMPGDVGALAISEGEDLCLQFARLSGMRVTILRFSEIYGTAGGASSNSINRLFEQGAVQDAAQEQLRDKRFSPIYVNDAVDAIYRVIADQEREGVFNVSAADTTLSHVRGKIRTLVTAAKDEGGEPAEQPVEPPPAPDSAAVQNLTVDSSRFSEAFDFWPFVNINTGLERLHRDIIKHERTSQKAEAKAAKVRSGFGKAVAPFLETFILFALFMLVGSWLRPVAAFASVDFSLVFIIIIAITFGLLQGSIAVLLSIAFLIFEKLNQGVAVLDMIINLTVMIQILQYFIIGTICGYSKDRMLVLISERKAELEENKKELDTIYKINDANASIKRTLNERITDYEDSLTKLYSIADRLNELQPDAVFFSAVNVIMEIMKTSDVSIYIVTGNEDFKMCRLMAESPSSRRELKKSFPLSDWGDLQASVERDEIFVNRDLQRHLPIMASPIFVNNQLVSILMIWSMEFEELTLYSENRFLVLSRLISSGIGRAYTYAQNMQNSMYLPGTSILMQAQFEHILSIHKDAATNNKTSYFVMLVGCDGMKAAELSNKVKPLIRANDYIGECPNDEEKIYILLTNTSSEESKFVYNRLERADLSVKEVTL